MDYFQTTMKVVSAVLMTYYFIIVVRVILSWVPSSSESVNRVKKIVHQITDPYMNRFRGISWLQFGGLDFSPVLGLMILTFLLYITDMLSKGYSPGAGEIIVLVISMIWGIIAFLATLFAIVMIVRLITLYTMKGSRPNWIDRIDAFVFPRVSRIMGVFTGKTVSYPLALGISAFLLLAFRIGIDVLLKSFLYPLILQL